MGIRLEPGTFEQGEVRHVADDGLAQIIGDLYPYGKTTKTYRSVPAEPVDRAAILAEIAAMAHAEDARATGHRLREPLLRRPRALPLPR